MRTKEVHMELNDILSYIKTASFAERSAIKAALKNPPVKDRVIDVCQAEIRTILDYFPHTTDSFKGYRYHTTGMQYVQYIKELTNAITHNYLCKHNSRGYPVWTGSDSVNGNNDDYKAVFHALTECVTNLMSAYGTAYKHASE